jgi:hypothetical protein
LESTWEVGACSVTVDVVMRQVKSLLKNIGVGDENNPVPELVQCVVLVQWAVAEASNAVETEEMVVRRLEGELAVARL